jgi:DNA repair photolyase
MLAKRFGKIKTYEEWITPEIAENAMEILDKEIPKFKDKIKILHLCFTTDPFMYGHKDICDLSIEILKKANDAEIRCSVLTKGILPAELADLPMDNEYGITVVSLDQNFINQYEPGAAPIQERIAALRQLSARGCKTWVSIEPYPTPNIIEQNLHEILESIGFVDKIIFGRLHYNKVVSEYKTHKEFFNNCAAEVREYCERNEIAYHIKDGTET